VPDDVHPDFMPEAGSQKCRNLRMNPEDKEVASQGKNPDTNL
jgi:hypothetical protein